MRRLAAAALVTVASGCGEEHDAAGTGSLSVLLEAEDTITRGLEAGAGPENLQDGWSARFDKYVVTIGGITLRLATDETVTAEASQFFVVDLAQIPAAGLTLWQLDELRAARWVLDYEVGGGSDAAIERHASVSEADYAVVTESALTYLIEGELSHPAGRACPPASRSAAPDGAIVAGDDGSGNPCYALTSLRFRFEVSSPTTFSRCEIDGLSGVAIPDGAVATAALTIHGDHLFFNGFPEGAEGGVTRLAQWLADGDLNLDGEVGRAELEQLRPSDLPVLDERYQLGTEQPIETMWDYLEQQLKTQGHLNGEGECSPL